MRELDKISENQGFKVPDNYFDNFPDNVLNKIKESSDNKKDRFRINPVFMAAASFVATLIIVFVLYKYNSDTELTYSDKIAYLECTIDYSDEDILIEEIASNDYVNADNYDENTYLQEELSEDDMIEFLSNQ